MSMKAKNLYNFSFSSADSVVLEFKILASSYTNQMVILETQRKCKFVTWSRPSDYEVVFVLCWSEFVPEHLFPGVLRGKVVAELYMTKIHFIETVVKEPIKRSEKHPK